MNNLDEKYLSYNPKDRVEGRARVPYNESKRAWAAPGGGIITTKAKAQDLAARINSLMSGKK